METIEYILRIVSSIVIFLAIFLGLTLLIDLLPPSNLWRSIDFVVFSISIFTFTLFDIIHFIIGLLIFCDGTIHMGLISDKLGPVIDHETYKPTKLITSGLYSKIRHPMYGMFMFLILGVAFSLCSYYGIVLIIIFFPIIVIIGIKDEKEELYPHFGNKYEEYAKKVKRRYLLPRSFVYFSFCLVFFIIGLIFFFI